MRSIDLGVTSIWSSIRVKGYATYERTDVKERQDYRRGVQLDNCNNPGKK
jgi:hypothetical protein